MFTNRAKVILLVSGIALAGAGIYFFAARSDRGPAAFARGGDTVAVKIGDCTIRINASELLNEKERAALKPEQLKAFVPGAFEESKRTDLVVGTST